MSDLVKHENSEVAVVSDNQAMTPMQLLQIATEKGVDVGVLERLMDLSERHEAKEAKKAFIRALNEFKKNPPQIVKDIQVSFGKTEYKHADLTQVAGKISDALLEVGISHRWKTSSEGQFTKVTCILTHEDGHSEDTSLQAGADNSGGKNPIQGIGSTVTYLQRYTLLAATGIAVRGEDDDGMQGDYKKLLNSDQRAEIDGLIDQSKTDKEIFCKTFGIKSVSDMKNSQYGSATRLLTSKIKKAQS